MQIHVTSDLVEPVDVLVRWQLEMIDGTILDCGEQNVRALALADTLVETLDLSVLVTSENQRKVVFVAEMWQKDKRLAQCVTPFIASKHLELCDPALQIQTRVDGSTLFVDVSARALARFVELSIDGADVIFSDNYFDIPAGQTITVTCPLPENWSATSKVKVLSLFDSFA
jgi:beta-mannosidase